MQSALGHYGLSWTNDEKNKLLIGSENDWPTAHVNLVPEQVISNLKRKLNGDGVELDDVTPIGILEHRTSGGMDSQ